MRLSETPGFTPDGLTEARTAWELRMRLQLNLFHALA